MEKDQEGRCVVKIMKDKVFWVALGVAFIWGGVFAWWFLDVLRSDPDPKTHTIFYEDDSQGVQISFEVLDKESGE